MSVIVYAETGDGGAAVRQCLGFEWAGVDGSQWNLGAGPVRIGPNVRGLMHPSWQDRVWQSPAVDGQWLRSTWTRPRDVSFTARFWDGDILAIHDAWWQSWSPRVAGVLTVTHGTERRSIDLRLQSSGDVSIEADPLATRYESTVIDAIADDPYWRGEPMVLTWGSASTPVEFFDPAGSPPFYIMQGSTLESAQVTNPGDADVWPVWTVTAVDDVTALSVSVAGGTITMPALSAGQVLRLDTDPARGGAQMGSMVGGEFVVSDPDVDGLVDSSGARRIPAGETVPVGIVLTGQGIVECSITPRYWLAF